MGKAKRIHNASERNPLNRPAVVIDVPFLDSHAHKNADRSNTASLSSLDASTSVSNFLLKLNAAVDLAAQVKECHEFKSKYRSCLLKKPLPDHVPSDLTILFILYLHPNYGPLHHCLDWITDASTRAIYAECLAPIREACLIILLHLENALFAHEHHLPLSAPFAKESVASLVEMASIDRDSGWMDSSTSTNSCLLIFLSTVNNILKLCLGVLFPENVAPDAVASLILTDSGLLYTETCAESLKAVSICLRSRRGKEALMPNDVSESRILTSILTSTFPLLTFDFINRDVITSIALGVVSIQWLLRNQSCDQPRSLRDLQRQLACFLQLLNLNDCGDMVDIKEAAEVGIHEALLLVMSTFSHTARNELFRACLSLYDSSLFGSSISADSSIHCSEDDGMLFTFVYTTMMGICSNDLVDVQFGGLQMVETWLNVVELLEVGSFAHHLDQNSNYCIHLVAKLVSISSMLSSIWSHPSKLINHIVPVVYQRMVEFIAKSAILRHTSNGKFLNELWGTLVSEAFQQPVHHRGRYQALNMLLPKVSAEFIVTSQSNIVKTLIDAVGCRDVSSSSTKLLGTLLRYLRDREGYDAARLRATFDNFAVEALCADLKKTRIASADYLLSELLAVDPECGPHLISCVRRLPPSFRHENKLYGITHITLQCRLLGLSGQGVISGGMDDADSLLTFLELRNLCLARDGDLRLSALFLIVASQKSSAPVVFAEWEVLRDTIFYSLKDGDADHRHRVLRVVKTLCIRVRESLRVAAREGRRAKERSELSTSAESPTLKPSQAELLASAVIDWLRDVCTINTFPGAAFDREIMTLDILSCVLEVADETITGPLLSAPLTSTILNMLLSSWDKSRHLAADVLLKFPRPLPAVISTAEAGLLLGLASALTGSARQRESDAGSQLIRIMFEIYCIDLDWPIHLSLPQSTQQIIYSGSRANARSFFDDMLSILRARLEGVGRLFSSTDRAQEGSNDSGTHLCHGLLLGLRYCMSSISNCLASGERGEVDQWKSLLHRTSELASQAMALGVSVVAEASSDVEFSPHLVINFKSPDTLGSINANSYMFVNTNGHMGAARDDGIESGSSEVQRAVVGAWLMVKESSALLARLVEMSLKLSHDSTEDILTVNEVDDIGQGFTNSLGRLKHMGAISEVHSALQKTAESVIRHGKDRELCALPLKWLQSLLAKLESKEQVFVLRRSSGFAYSFLSLLRAEVFDSKPLLLPVAMKSLLNNAFEGVTFSQSGDGDDAFLEAKDEGWRTCVHALNIIRLMLLDASLGQGIGPYITSCTVIAVTGFKSKRWAVRNSCMMVFAAVVQRAVANEKNDYANVHASTPNELFQSYPKLFHFLLKELSDATGSANNSDSKLDTLYPLLLFLAKLRPELIETKKEEEDMNTDNFLVPIEICSGMRHMAVRAMAAKALKSLVPCNLVPKHISRIAGTLLSNPRHLSTNRIHGTLLLILELLESWAQNTPQEKVPNEMEAIIAVLDTILFCDNYARAFSCPSVLLVKLRIMTSVVALRSSSSAKVLLWTLIFTHLRPLFVEEAHDTESPSSPLLLREMLVSFFPLFMDLSLKEYKAIEEDKRRISLTDLLNLLHHRMSEVREGLLRGLLLIVDVSASVGMADLAKLALPILLQRCSYETFPPLLELVLRAFSSLTEFTSFSDLDADFATAFHDSLPTLRSLIIETIAPQSSDGSVATEAMRMRGLETSASVTRILAWSISSSCPMSTLADFVLILESSVDDDVPDSQRLVAAQTWSVVFTAVSSLKKDGRSEFAELQCRVWLLALTLIQDDSEDVREAISYSLLPAILADRHGDSVMPIDSFLLGHLGRSVSRALEPFLIRDSLSTETSTEVLTILINRYLAALPTIASSGNVFRIFEEEVSNLFKEPIMTFDLLHHVIYRAFDVYISSALLTAHDKGLAIFRPVASRGMEVLRTYLDMTLSPHWIGDASFQKEIFSSLYGAVLLLAPMVRLLENSPHVNISPDDKASLVTITSLMAAIAEEIPDIRGARHMHPLIFKLVS